MSEAEKTSKAGGFFTRVKAEFKRCTWPKRDELIRQSALVIVVSVILGGIIAGIDWLIRLGVSEKTAIEDACRIEHDISDETFEILKKHCFVSKKTRQ